MPASARVRITTSPCAPTGPPRRGTSYEWPPPAPDALPPAIDLEFGGNCSGRPSRATLHREVDEFLQIIEAAWDRPAVLYVFHSFEQRYGIREANDRPLWIPSYPRRPRGDWAVWQLHGFARVEGVTGGVDLDVGRLGELEDSPPGR